MTHDKMGTREKAAWVLNIIQAIAAVIAQALGATN